MVRMAPEELAKKISGGLSFPVTHFTKDFAFDEQPYRDRMAAETQSSGSIFGGWRGRVLLRVTGVCERRSGDVKKGM